MSNQLVFNGTSLSINTHNNQIWLTSSDIAIALQYKSADAVTKIYNRNMDEFSHGMTETVNLGVSGNYQKTVRIFSLRGAHLIAMFARTPIAKEFRKWVLDILDKQTGSYETKAKTTTDERSPLRDAINLLVGKKGMMYPEAYNFVHQRFNVAHIDELSPEQVPLAIEYIHRLVLNGEYLPKEKEIVQGTLLDDRQLYYVYFLLKHFNHLNEIFHRYNLHTHLTELGCRAAIEMVGHFNDGSIVNLYLKDLSPEFVAVQRRLGLNQL